jgi:hypothetical protein
MAKEDVRAERIARLLKPFRITEGKGFRLKDIDPDDTGGLEKDEAQEYLARGVDLLCDMQ